MPQPPAAWAAPYAAMAVGDALEWRTLDALHDAVRRFLDPVLSEATTARWSPASWTWSAD